MQSTPASSGEFINTGEEALKGNGRLAPEPFARKEIWSRDLLPACDTLQKGSISLHCRINAFNCVKPNLITWMVDLLRADHLDVFCIGAELCLGRETLLGLMCRLWYTPKQNCRSYTRVLSRLWYLGTPLHLQGEIQAKDVFGMRTCTEGLWLRWWTAIQNHHEESRREQQEKALWTKCSCFLIMYIEGKPERDPFDFCFVFFTPTCFVFPTEKCFLILFFKLLCIFPVGKLHLTSVCVCILDVWHFC